MREHEQEKDILRRAVFMKRADPKLQKTAVQIGEGLIEVCKTGSWGRFGSAVGFAGSLSDLNLDDTSTIALMTLLDAYGPLRPWKSAFRKWAGWSVGLWDRMAAGTFQEYIEAVDIDVPGTMIPLFFFDRATFEVAEQFENTEFEPWYSWQITGSPRTWIDRSVLTRIEELMGAIDPAEMIDNAPLISAKITIDAWIKDARLAIALS